MQPSVANAASIQSKPRRGASRVCSDHTWAFVQFAKTGSSAMRQCEKKVIKSCNHFVQTGYSRNGEYAGHYFTLLREPVARAISSWAYFCAGCREKHRFCADRAANASVMSVALAAPYHAETIATECPRMGVVEWTKMWGNSYVQELSGANAVAADRLGKRHAWLGQKLTSPGTSQMSMLGASGWTLGLREKVGDAAADIPKLSEMSLEEQLEEAKRVLANGTVLALPLEELDGSGWARLDAVIGPSPDGHSWKECSSNATTDEAVNVNVDKPDVSAGELRQLKRLLAPDLELYQRTRSLFQARSR